MKQIALALCKAQKQFAPALKTSTNPHFKSKYVGLDGCIEAVIDALNNNGIYLMQKSHDCENGVKVETILLHESGEEYSGGILHVPASKQDAQGYGSALTYARRYSLMASCGIAPEDDDGNAAARKVVEKLPELKSVTIDDFDADEQQFLRDTAMEIISFVDDGDHQSAFDLTVNLDNDEKLALWGLLDSKCRSSLKKSASTQRKAA